MSFKKKIASGEPLYGIIVTMGLPSVSEMLSHCGFDWLWIDMEHAPLSLIDVQTLAQSTRKECATLVRIPTNTDEWIKRVLDLGVSGIIVPHVNTKEETERAIRASCYPPQGNRSLGGARAGLYGLDSNYKAEANTKRLMFVQIEHHEAVKNIESIVQVSGLDGVIVGPYDLSASLGKMGKIHDPEILTAIQKVVKVCKKFHKPLGIFSKTPADAKKYVEQGFQLVAIGIDAQYLSHSAKVTIDSLKAPV